MVDGPGQVFADDDDGSFGQAVPERMPSLVERAFAWRERKIGIVDRGDMGAAPLGQLDGEPATGCPPRIPNPIG